MNHEYPEYYSPLLTASMEDLERLASVISMEAAGNASFTFDPRGRMEQFFNKASGFFSKFSLPQLNLAKLMPTDMVGVVGRLGFVDASNKNIIVPESFTGQWVPYSNALREAMQKAIQVEGMVLAFNQTLGRIIADPGLLHAASGIGHNGQANVGLNDALVEIGKTYFDPKSNHIERTLGAVIERTQDIATTHVNLNEAVALDKARPAKKALDAVNRTMVLADKVVPLVGETGTGAVSKVAVQELINITLQIAKEMEAYGALLFRIRQFSEALKDSLKAIKK